MATTTKKLGIIPINRGNYSDVEYYYKDNIVQYKNCSYYCKSLEPIIGITPRDNSSEWGLFSGTSFEEVRDALNNFDEKLQELNNAKKGLVEATENANTKAKYAEYKGNYANEKADYAQQMGDYAKEKADIVQDGFSPTITEDGYWKTSEGITNIKAQGPQGIQGVQGIQGEKGDAFVYEDFTQDQLDSLKGERGEQGLKGDKGDTGDKGEIGITPNILAVSGENINNTGIPLVTASTSEDKTTTIFTFNYLKGEKGARGNAGPEGNRGEQGPKGDKGDVGPIPNIIINEGEHINEYGTPTVSYNTTDDKLNTTITFDYLKGGKGDKGDKGDTPVIKVESGEFISEVGIPTIEAITDENNTTKLIFNYLKGQKGDKGEKGNVGDKGDKGDAFIYSDFTQAQLESIRGPQGIQGPIGDKGDKGDRGYDFNYTWDGTRLGIKNSSEISYSYTDLKGEKGDIPIVNAKAGENINRVGIPRVVSTTNNGITDISFDYLKGVQGEKGEKGDPFYIYKTYVSKETMDADLYNVSVGQFVMITSNTEDVDNAKMFYRNPDEWVFICDFSGAQGIQGPQGYNFNYIWDGTRLGVKNSSESNYNFSDLKGEKGDKGEKGEKGDKGDKGDKLTFADLTDSDKASIKGERGEQGATGIQGPQGEKGEKGDKLTFADLTTSDKAALKGEKGDIGNRGYDFNYTWSDTRLGVKDSSESDYIYVDLKGDKGDSGVGISSITTKVTSSIDGEKNIYRINLTNGTYTDITISNGSKGLKGDAGIQGPKGEKGDTGDPMPYAALTQAEYDALSDDEKNDGIYFIFE